MMSIISRFTAMRPTGLQIMKHGTAKRQKADMIFMSAKALGGMFQANIIKGEVTLRNDSFA